MVLCALSLIAAMQDADLLPHPITFAASISACEKAWYGGGQSAFWL
jgi:hypothetical protein